MVHPIQATPTAEVWTKVLAHGGHDGMPLSDPGGWCLRRQLELAQRYRVLDVALVSAHTQEGPFWAARLFFQHPAGPTPVRTRHVFCTRCPFDGFAVLRKPDDLLTEAEQQEVQARLTPMPEAKCPDCGYSLSEPAVWVSRADPDRWKGPGWARTAPDNHGRDMSPAAYTHGAVEGCHAVFPNESLWREWAAEPTFEGRPIHGAKDTAPLWWTTAPYEDLRLVLVPAGEGDASELRAALQTTRGWCFVSMQVSRCLDCGLEALTAAATSQARPATPELPCPGCGAAFPSPAPIWLAPEDRTPTPLRGPRGLAVARLRFHQHSALYAAARRTVPGDYMLPPYLDRSGWRIVRDGHEAFIPDDQGWRLVLDLGGFDGYEAPDSMQLLDEYRAFPAIRVGAQLISLPHTTWWSAAFLFESAKGLHMAHIEDDYCPTCKLWYRGVLPSPDRGTMWPLGSPGYAPLRALPRAGCPNCGDPLGGHYVWTAPLPGKPPA